jgi:hypothetical protein
MIGNNLELLLTPPGGLVLTLIHCPLEVDQTHLERFLDAVVAWQDVISVATYAHSLRLFTGRETEFAPDCFAMVVNAILDVRTFVVNSAAAKRKIRRTERDSAAHFRCGAGSQNCVAAHERA